MKRRLPLTTTAGCSAGFVTIVAHTVIDLGEHSRNSSNPQSPLAQEENMVLYQHRRTHSLPPRLLSELRRPPQGWISIYFTEPITRTYRFHSGLGGDIGIKRLTECNQWPFHPRFSNFSCSRVNDGVETE